MRNFTLLIMLCSIGFTAADLDAGWLTATRRELYRSHQRSQCWPHPYNLMDEQSVREPFRLMIERGWQSQNTIRNEHFEEGTEKLNTRGRRQVQWVLSCRPATRRVLFVEPGQSVDQTSRRLAAVEQMARYANDDTGVEVILTTVTTQEHARKFVQESERRDRSD